MVDENPPEETRRNVLQSFGTFGVAGVIGERLSAGQPTDKAVPDTYDKHGTQGKEFSDPAYFRHISDLPATQQRLRRYERTGNRREVITPHLLSVIKNSDKQELDITVSTTGRKATYISDGHYNRKLHGWQPTPGEVKKLSEYGNIEFSPDIISTKVGISGVAQDAVSEIADLGFVLEIGYEPEVKAPNSVSGSTETTASTPTADDLKSSSHSSFDSVSQDIDSGIQIGHFTTGYPYGDGGNTTPYSKNWAEYQGIDTSTSKDFTGNGTWQDAQYHGSMVSDTAAYMLSGRVSWDNHIILRVWEPDNYTSTSGWRNAIEYATKNGIHVGISSLETTAHEPYCTSTLCEELDSYTSAGYAMTVATGNDNKKSEVCHPATSYHAISVGGYNGGCSGGYARGDGKYGSNYGNISYYDSTYDHTYCSWCRNGSNDGDAEFQPNVYSCKDFYTDDGNTVGGTSAASPVVAAGTAIHASANGAIDYYDYIRKYNSMSNYTVCPSESSGKGGVLHVPDLD